MILVITETKSLLDSFLRMVMIGTKLKSKKITVKCDVSGVW